MSDQKRIDARRANDGNRKPPGKCKMCGLEIPYSRKLCDEHKPQPKTLGHCQNCGGLSGSNRDIQYCKTCRTKGLHKKKVFSICSACGEKIPDKYGRKYCDLCLDRFYKSKRTTPRRVDANQGDIVRALLSVGCSIVDTSDVGGGFPDLIVGRNRKNYLIEIKNPEAKGKLNELQEKFIANWPAQIHVVHSIEEALDVVMEGAEDE